MKQATLLTLATICVLELGFLWLGYDAMSDIAYGAIAIMASLIAATFMWLWFERTTPLAIGMVLSWLGIACIAGWWWAYGLMGAPVWLDQSPGIFAVLALPFVGSILHFAVVQRSFGYHGMHFLWPIGGAISVSVLVYLLV